MMLADFDGRKEVLMGSLEIELENWMKMEYVTDCRMESSIFSIYLEAS